ncbi:leukocyte receptor cluster member 8 homolog [Cylas formicarius]|uniref:leukocyte receptor cluster member 8 homolog n=1 Tax=Cylas formicarius TaxID=197179 RepID=UPI002958B6F3|nr:leukocyte receptor cluster member 8 homolog [Cylas formicarius]
MTDETDVSQIPPPPGTEPSAPPPPPPLPESKPPPPPPEQNSHQLEQNNWLPYYMANGFNFSHPYSSYAQQQYWYSAYPYMSGKDLSKIQPPLPAPPLPQNNNTPRAPMQFSSKPIRFQLNGKRLPNPSAMVTGSPNSGAAKKKRKRNRNNQMQNHIFNNAPPLPPSDFNMPKPEPPPETMPPLPPHPSNNEPLLPSLPLGKNQQVVNKPVQQHLNGGNPTEDWPQSLKDYVHNCYSKCKTTIDKNQVEIILKGKITAAYQSGQLHKDWSKEPLPNIYSDSKQEKTVQQGGKFTGQVKTVVGQLAQFQNSHKKGLSPAMGARLGARASLRGRNASNSRSRSRSPRKQSGSRSPPKRHRATSSSSSEENGFVPLKSKKSKLANRLGPQKKNNKSKKNKAKEKKAPFYQSFGQDVEENKELLEQRAARFNNGPRTSNVSPTDRSMIEHLLSTSQDDSNPGDFDWSGVHIVGTCQDIEKSFLRLTKAPEACDIRPVEVLRKSLVNVKDKWLAKQDYFYACDQLKSIRQDLTVQGVRNEFTIQVYETHARIALEKGDHEEFNQCQTQLKALYSDVGGDNRNEFVAYRILYYIFTKNTLDIMTIMKYLSPEEKGDPCIAFALKMRSAWGSGNFHRFFRMYAGAPLMTGFLIDWFIERERKAYLKCIIKSYRQTVTLTFLTQELAFNTEEECLGFLDSFSLTFTDPSRTVVDCKGSMPALSNF